MPQNRFVFLNSYNFYAMVVSSALEILVANIVANILCLTRQRNVYRFGKFEDKEFMTEFSFLGVVSLEKDLVFTVNNILIARINHFVTFLTWIFFINIGNTNSIHVQYVRFKAYCSSIDPYFIIDV